jgi:hypothetical protein
MYKRVIKKKGLITLPYHKINLGIRTTVMQLFHEGGSQHDVTDKCSLND